MSGGGGSSNTTTTTKQELPAWALGPASQLLYRANTISERGYTPYNGQQIAGFTPDQLTAQNMIRGQALGAGQDFSNAATQFNQGILQGQGAYTPERNPYAGGNPELSNLIQNAQNDVTRAYSNTVAPNLMAQFNASGAYGGTAHQSALANSQNELAQQLGEVSTNLRSQDYDRQVALAESDINRRQQAANDFQGRQLQALALSPQTQQLGYGNANMLANVGGAQQGLLQSIFDQNYANFTEARDWDGRQLGLLGDALGTITGGYRNSSATGPNLTPRASPWAGALGGAATGASMGSAAGPWGTAIGALIGAGAGYFGSK